MRCRFNKGHEIRAGDEYVRIVRGIRLAYGVSNEEHSEECYCKKHWDYCIGLIDKLRGTQ